MQSVSVVLDSQSVKALDKIYEGEIFVKPPRSSVGVIFHCSFSVCVSFSEQNSSWTDALILMRFCKMVANHPGSNPNEICDLVLKIKVIVTEKVPLNEDKIPKPRILSKGSILCSIFCYWGKYLFYFRNCLLDQVSIIINPQW